MSRCDKQMSLAARFTGIGLVLFIIAFMSGARLLVVCGLWMFALALCVVLGTYDESPFDDAQQDTDA